MIAWKPVTKIYLGGLLVIGLICFLLSSWGNTLRQVGLTAFALFAVLDVWYIFKIRTLRKDQGGATQWKKEILWIAVCLAIILYVVLRRLL